MNSPDGIPGWATVEAGIAASVRRMCAVMAPDGDDAALEALQVMADRLLDRCPTASAAGLEHRLACLCDAVEALGPWAPYDDMVDFAVTLARRLN